MSNTSKFEEIYERVRAIPEGKVASYGQIASACGATARTVGWAMAIAPEDAPWHRVVAVDGYLSIARRSPELMLIQKRLLEDENVSFLENGCVDMTRCRASI
jgi:methylated-DNA-protein-cysteine methyltransferase-like protein